MSTISVAWNGANSAVNDFSDYKRDLSVYIASLRAVKTGGYLMLTSGYRSIFRTLDSIIDRLENNKDGVKNLKNGLDDVLREYSRYENDITDTIHISSEFQETLREQLEDAGFGLDDIADLFEDLGFLYSIAGGVQAFTDAVDVGWLDVIFSAGQNLFENIGEYGENCWQMWTEFITETGVDVGVGVAATAVGVAVAGVLSPYIVAAVGAGTAATVIGATVTAAVAVGVPAIANAVCEWVTGTFGDEARDLGEVFADFQVERIENIIDAGQELFNNVQEGIENIGEAVADGWNSLCEWASGLFA